MQNGIEEMSSCNLTHPVPLTEPISEILALIERMGERKGCYQPIIGLPQGKWTVG
jgi:hypothetical protein